MNTSHRWFYKLQLRLRSLFLRRRVESELSEELQYHLERQIEENIAAGMDPQEARYAATRMLGGIDQRKEECRDARGVSLLENGASDLRYGLRMLRKNPGFGFAVIATVALGIGATTAMFSVVYGVLLRPLPYPEQDRLVAIGHDWRDSTVGVANFLDWRTQNSVFEEVGITKLVQNFNLTGDGEAERVLGGRSTPGIFRVLQVNPILGRVFTPEDGDVEDKVVLSEGLWRRRYAADPAILGRKIQLNGRPYTVLGVMPADFQYPNREFALWTPLSLNPRESRSLYDYGCIARLKAGVTIERAQEEMSRIQAGIGRAYPEIAQVRVVLTPMLELMVGRVRTALYFLMGAVLCLLLIGSANLANLLVARSMTRSHEFALRTALGARKDRLVLQSVMELVPMIVLGGAGGLLLSRWLLSLLLPLLPTNIPRLEAIRMDWQVLLFALVFLCLSAFAAAVWPTVKVMRWNLNLSLRESARTTISSGAASRLRSGLVVLQIAAVTLLLVVSSLLIRSFVTLRSVDPGFRTENILTVHFALSAKYGATPAFGDYLKRILDRVSAIPGVESAGMTNRIPLSGASQTGTEEFEGIDQPVSTDRRTASAEYFRTMGIPLVEGRTFSESDIDGRPKVGIIDDKLARQLWPKESAVGKRFRFGGDDEWHEIVGVVGHVKHDGLGVDRRSQVYWSYHQRVQPRMAIAVRTAQDPRLLTASVIAAIHEVDPEQPVYDVRPMDEVLARSVSPQWLNTALLSLFAGIALVLATVGVYGVMSYSVGVRSREIGIRMALGSRRGEVIWMILRHGGALALLGTGIGLGASLLLREVLVALLYEIKPTDTVSFAAAAILLLLVALLACFIPARRAASVDPLSVLRSE